ncbi:hypothetical protein [Paenibacillus sp. SI8]|uniref:hypothetical protein n=1 Tax=unclassified Paenibacillus TaxID=185978 RepID=UPI003466EF8D
MRELLYRVVASFVVILGNLTLVFVILHFLPGDAVTIMMGESGATPLTESLSSMLIGALPLLGLSILREYPIMLDERNVGALWIVIFAFIGISRNVGALSVRNKVGDAQICLNNAS